MGPLDCSRVKSVWLQFFTVPVLIQLTRLTKCTLPPPPPPRHSATHSNRLTNEVCFISFFRVASFQVRMLIRSCKLVSWSTFLSGVQLRRRCDGSLVRSVLRFTVEYDTTRIWKKASEGQHLRQSEHLSNITHITDTKQQKTKVGTKDPTSIS